MTRLLALTVLVLALLPAAAQAATDTSVTMYSDSGDYIGGGVQRLFHPGNAQVAVSGSEGGVSVSVSGGDRGDAYGLEFTAPPGAAFGPGTYDRAQRSPFREATRPGIDVSGDGRGCNQVSGRFEVREYVRGPGAAVERLWLVYESHCEGGTAATWGEVRINVPVADGSPAPAASLIRWPESAPGRAGTVVPVTVRAASGAGRVTGVSVVGANPGDFELRLDECSGRDLPVGSACEVFVRFRPAAPGTREAVLRIVDGGGTAREVGLQGWSPGGRTRLDFSGPPGEYISGGRSYAYTPANASLVARGSRSLVSFGVVGSDSNDWGGTFQPGDGDIIAPGRYPGATRHPFNGPEPGVDISGSGRGCNRLSGEFTVTEAAFEPDGALRSLGVSFRQSCDGGPVLTGTFEQRAGDTTSPAPWMASAPRPTLTPGTGGGGGTGGSGPGTGGSGPGTGGSGPGTGGSGSGSGGASAPVPTVPPTSGAGIVPIAAPATGAPVVAPTGPCATRRFSRRLLLEGSPRPDRLRGGRRSERIYAGAGNDRVTAGRGADCVDGGSGADRLDGGPGEDLLVGGAGDDVLVGGTGRDVLDCGAGRRDVARVGRGDRVRGCERILRG